MKKDLYILWFKQIDKEDISLVGGKGANLGEMAKINLPVPDGFVVTSKAYYDFIAKNDLKDKIFKVLSKVNREDPQSYLEASSNIKNLILDGEIPKEISSEIIKSYLKLGGLFKNALVAVRSSATAEDLPTASFAGQQVTFLNICGEAEVVKKVKECWASLFEARAIFYREENNFDHFKVGIAVPVQKMIQSEASGVMFTCDPVTSKKDRIIIEAIYGLGEMIVQGAVTPDHYEVDKENLKILSKFISKQPLQLIKVGKTTKKVAVQFKKQSLQKISDKQILELAKLGLKIHHHYFFPQDIEWALEKGKIYILQTRPVTTIKKSEERSKEKFSEEEKIKLGKIILEGQGASPGIATGKVKIINSLKEINKVSKGDVLVTSMTTPDFVPAMKKAVAIVTDKGGQTSHAAIVSRELGIPCVVGTKNGTSVLKKFNYITVDGLNGRIYKGSLETSKKTIKEVELKESGLIEEKNRSLARTATKIYVNLAEPALAEEISKKNVDGIGLLRAEFMIAQIGRHPKKFIKERKQKIFIDKLSEDIAKFCQAFYPRPVVYRATDFKTNEYRNLVGGEEFEPKEPNPMLGFRGARRYILQSDVFEMEIETIKKVRNKIGLKNLWLMIPFVRTPQELLEVKKMVVAGGLSRSPSFQLWMMVEIPSNVILLEDFLKIGIDGVSIGSNDLTMLILGTDRDNSEVAPVFDERNPAVLWAIEKVIKTCLKNKVTCSLCGQAPSEYPDFVEKLVEWGITSISVNPDAIDKTREIVYEKEREIWSK